MSENQYFAARQAEDTVNVLLDKAGNWQNILEDNGYQEKIRACWAAYHGAYYTDISDGHQIVFTGEQEELANLPINHLRNLGQHILNITTSNRPTMEARASNTDYKSLSQTILANGLLDYYMREKRLETYLKRAVEYAIVMGAGYIKMAWNATSGEIYDYNEETSTPIYPGDVEFSNLSPFDVIFDTTKETGNHDWLLCRTFKNKYDLMAKYPELEKEIREIPDRSQVETKRFNFNNLSKDTTDDVAVYEFYQKRTESMPDGRYLLFLSEKAVLADTPLPYRDIPVFRLAPSDILGTPYGYTPLFDIMPIQEGINTLYSTILTNQNAFGVQNILVPNNSNINFTELSGGLNAISYNPQAGKPEALNLTQTPAEIFKFLEILEQSAETISGVNSVSRGNPEASLKSGTALALVQSMTLQFLSGLQQSYVQLIEDTGTSLINMLRDFAAVPRVAAIVGKANRSYMKEFKGDDLSSVNRVIVDVGNPLARSTAGKVEMAEQLMQMGLITTPDQYFMVLNTGKLDTMFEGKQTEILLIRDENENMMRGNPVPVISFDNHVAHIREHKSILANPDLRKDGKLVQIVLDHIQEHLTQLKTVDPDLLNIIEQPPLSPQGQGVNQAGGGTPASPPQDQMMTESGPVNMPNMPTPPAPFEDMPVTTGDIPAPGGE